MLERLSLTLEKEIKKLTEAKTETDDQDIGANAKKKIHSNSDSDTSRSDETLQDKRGSANVGPNSME